MRNTSIVLAGLVSIAALGLAGCDVQKTKEGNVTAPKFEVSKTKEGDVTLPKYDVTAPKVEVTTEKKTVDVTVPKVEVTPANQVAAEKK